MGTSFDREWVVYQSYPFSAHGLGSRPGKGAVARVKRLTWKLDLSQWSNVHYGWWFKVRMCIGRMQIRKGAGLLRSRVAFGRLTVAVVPPPAPSAQDQCNLGSLVLFSIRATDVLRWRNRVAGRLSEGPQISVCFSRSACAWSSSFWPACMLADQPLTPGWYTFNCVSLQAPRHCQISPIPM